MKEIKLQQKESTHGSLLSPSSKLRYPYPEDRGFFNRDIPDICVVLRETSFTISDLTGKLFSIEFEITGVISLYTAEISELALLK